MCSYPPMYANKYSQSEPTYKMVYHSKGVLCVNVYISWYYCSFITLAGHPRMHAKVVDVGLDAKSSMLNTNDHILPACIQI